MPGRKLPIFVVSIGLSLAVHFMVGLATKRVSVRSDLAPVVDPVGNERTIHLVLNAGGEPKEDFPPPAPEKPKKPTPPEKLPPSPTTPPTPPPPPPNPKKPDVQRFPEQIGRSDGTGFGTHEAKGEKPLIAPQADQDQPALSRDPRGVGAPRDPAQSIRRPGDGGHGGTPNSTPPAPRQQAAIAPSPPETPPAAQPVEHAEQGEYRPGPITVKIPASDKGEETTAEKIDPTAKLKGPLTAARPGLPGPEAPPAASNLYGPPQATVRPPVDANVHPSPAGIQLLPPPPPLRVSASPPPAPLPMRVPPAAEANATAQVQPAAQPPRPPPTPVVKAGDSGRPGAPTPSADPAQQSDSESDAFSKIGSWDVRRDGSLPVAFGRQVKTVRPRINISGMLDSALGAQSVTMKVNIGPTGSVTAVTVTKSSGSNEIDQPSLVAMYDWWFEPLKDKKGHAVSDVVYFTLNFR